MNRRQFIAVIVAALAALLAAPFLLPTETAHDTTGPAPTVQPANPSSQAFDLGLSADDFQPTPTPSPEPEPTKAEPAPAPKPAAARSEPAPAPKPAPKPGPDVVTLAPITAFESQAAVDSGAVVTWFDPAVWDLCLLAGHDNMGWAWLDDIRNGTIVRVTTGPCAGEYEVVGHRWHAVKGGTAPDWMWDYDLVLQTCTGATGTGFSLAVRR